MKRVSRRRLLLSAAAMAAGSGLGLSGARAAAGRPATLIVPAAADSRTGFVGRRWAAALEAQNGAPVNVMFAAPEEAYAMLAQARPDGGTLGLVSGDVSTLYHRGLSSVSPSDLVPLALVADDPAGIHVRAERSWGSLSVLHQDIKGTPAAVRLSGAGRAAIWHLSALRWLKAGGVQPPPWQAASGPPEAIENLASGRADVVVCSIPEVRATPQARAVRTLGVMSRQRHVRYPDVPSVSEARLGVEAGFWRMIAGPKGLDQARAQVITPALRATFVNTRLAGELHRKGFALAWREGKAAQQFYDAEVRVLGELARGLG
jgi:tripartite-type tricarboxylate transporter receptor subunit TctC